MNERDPAPDSPAASTAAAGAGAGAATPEGLDEYRLDAPGEIQSWLRELMQARTRVQLSTPDGALLHTVLLALDAPQGVLTFEGPVDPAVTAPVLASMRVTATAYLDRIKLEFELPGLLAARDHGGEVLRAALPRHLYRFQRRQAYRVQSPGQLYPALRLNQPDGLRIRVVNVSGGGLALQWPQAAGSSATANAPLGAAGSATPGATPGTAPGATVGVASRAAPTGSPATLPPPPEAGAELTGTLELEREVSFSALLRVQHVTPGEGQAPHQLGCAFVSLAPSAARALQVFIDQAQKRERLMKRPGG